MLRQVRHIFERGETWQINVTLAFLSSLAAQIAKRTVDHAPQFRTIGLNDTQVLQISRAAPSKRPKISRLAAFLRVAQHRQLIRLRGTTPVAFDQHVRKDKKVSLLAIVGVPKPGELPIYDLTEAKAAAQRQAVRDELTRRGMRQ